MFGDFSINTLLNSKELNIHSEDIISLNDDLCVGSIYQLSTEAGRSDRRAWLMSISKNTFIESLLCSFVEDDYLKIEALKKELKSIDELYIWTGTTALDRLYTGRFLYELRDLDVKFFIADFQKITLKSLSGRFFSPKSLTVVASNQVHLIANHFQQITNEDKLNKINLWKTLSDSKEVLRVLENETIKFKELTYFDSILLSYCTEEFKHPARIIGESLIDIDFAVHDSILNWRLKQLVSLNKLEAEGELKDMRDYRVKTKYLKKEVIDL